MRRRNVVSFWAVVVCLAGSVAAQWEPGDDTPVAGMPASDADSRAGMLEDYRAELDKAYGAYGSTTTLNDADLYPLALARISEVHPLIANDPDDEELIEMFQVCSLYAEAAYVQLQVLGTRAQIASMNHELRNTLSTLAGVQESIIRIESSHATDLKQQLDKEKAKAQALQEEMEKKFNALQSELISVSKTARGTIISMSDILFDIGKASLKPDLKTNLAKIAGILTVYRNVRVLVEGHTDNTGSDEFNQKLSEDRALNVMQYLIEQGVDSSRLRSHGYGETKPVADNETKEGRQKNRRVDLVVMEKKKPQ
ncbi:MAG: OmpA family protein [Chitinivibrionales bacterium]|nr:OmpA family protein [Chitinivibrionales bacterium]